MAVVERMNFDGRFLISGVPTPAAAHRELLLELLASDDPDIVRPALAEAQKSRDLLSEPLLEILETLTPEIAEESNVPVFAMYLLAAWRETRAFEPLLRYFEEGGEAANEALDDVVAQDLPAMLGSIVAGRFDRIRGLIENEEVDQWVRGAAIDTLVASAVRGELAVEEVEAYFEQLIATGSLAGDVWMRFASAAADLASKRLLPYVERAHAEGLLDEVFITLDEIRASVRGGRELAFGKFRKTRESQLVDDVVQTTRWWDFWNKRKRDNLAPVLGKPARSPRNDDFGDDFDDDHRYDSTPYEPVQQVVRATPKVGRNDPCPCGSGKKYKKCCGE